MSQDDQNPTETTFAPVAVPAPVPDFDVVLEPPNFGPQGRPLLGGSLWVFGALLWAYLVMGELVVNLEVNEAFAMLIVIAASGIAWYGAVRHAPPAKMARRIAPGVIGIVLWVFAVFLAAVLCGTTRRSTVQALTVVFCFPAVAAYFVGRRLTANPKLEVSRRRRAGGIALWVGCSLATAMALLSAVGHM